MTQTQTSEATDNCVECGRPIFSFQGHLFHTETVTADPGQDPFDLSDHEAVEAGEE